MWVKLCGIRDLETARFIASLDVNAIGLNFYQPSARCVDLETARQIADCLPATMASVGVFVNHAPQEVARIAEFCGLSGVQLHGDETPEVVAEIARLVAPRFLIRAFRVGEEGLGEVATTLQTYRELGISLFGCLIDARVAGSYGGTGLTAPWDLLATGWQTNGWPPLILAGGLTPANVHSALATVQPWGLDTAGGVESKTGVKDPDLMIQFVQQARTANLSKASS